MATTSRTVRVFLSSTFRDFAQERDLLVRKVFPELRRMCRARQVDLVDVDLRWGITEEEARQGRVLPICLAEIERSRPYFVGFIGERYGWVPERNQYDPALLIEQTWLEQHRGGTSVTELEILHGVLNNPCMKDRAFFYFRDPKWSREQGRVYLPEGPEERAKLDALKDRIRKSGFPVEEGYSDPEALAGRVKADLWQLIDEAFPEDEVPDPLAREAIPHEQFAASRRGLYIGGEGYLAALDGALAADASRPVLVTGESGGGKSALLANWAAKVSRENPKAIAVTHFLGVGADAANAVGLVTRLLREIARFTGAELVLEGDPRNALSLLGNWLARAGEKAVAEGTVFLVVIDALDKLSAQRDLEWLPRSLPAGVALVVSCLEGAVLDAARGRTDWTEIRVLPMGPGERGEFIVSYFKKYGKAPPEKTASMLAHPLSGNPLFLRTLLEELRVFGVHEELDWRLGYYLESGSLDDLFERVLERVETDNGVAPVRAVLEVLWAAQESFPENELLEIAGVPPAVWASVHVALEESLIGAGGRLAFGHDYLRKAVGDRYLTAEVDRERIRRRMAEFCAAALSVGRREVSDYVRRQAVRHFVEARDWEGAVGALSDLEFIASRAIAQELSAMLGDYALVLRELPEAREEAGARVQSQAVLMRWSKELSEYCARSIDARAAGGDPPALPVPPPAIRPKNEEELGFECARIRESATRTHTLSALRRFVATQAGALEACAARQDFVAQHAFNDAPEGPVHERGKALLASGGGARIVRKWTSADRYNPLEPCTMILKGDSSRASAVAISWDASRLITGHDLGALRFWDLASGEGRRVMDGDLGPRSAVGISANGRFAVWVIGDGSLRVWDLNTGGMLQVLEGPFWDVSAVAISADGSIVVASTQKGTQRVWDVRSGRCLRQLKAHKWLQDDEFKIGEPATSLAISADASFAVGTAKDYLYFWDLDSGECIGALYEQNGYRVVAVAIASDSSFLISAGEDSDVRIWSLNDRKAENWKHVGGPLRTLEGHRCAVFSVALSADGSLALSADQGGEVRMWDLKTGECLRVFKSHVTSVYSLAISADASMAVSGNSDGTICVWDLSVGQCTLGAATCSGEVTAISIATDGDVAVSGSRGAPLRIWDRKTGECVRVMGLEPQAGEIVAVSGDGSTALSCRVVWNGGLQFWDLKSGTLQVIYRPAKYPSPQVVDAAAIAVDGRTGLAGHISGDISVWDLSAMKCVNVLEGHTEAVGSIAIAAAAPVAVSGGDDRTLRVWDLESGACVRTLGVSGSERTISDVRISADGLVAASVRNGVVCRVWDVKSGQCIREISVEQIHLPDQWAKVLALSADGSLLVLFGGDKNVQVWDLRSGKCVAVLAGLQPSCFALQGAELLIGTRLGQVHFYNLENIHPGNPANLVPAEAQDC